MCSPVVTIHTDHWKVSRIKRPVLSSIENDTRRCALAVAPAAKADSVTCVF